MNELRRDAITGRGVIVVPGRSARPNEHAASPSAAANDAGCPFCAGNEATTPPELAAIGPPGRMANAPGWFVRTIPNKFPTVSDQPPASEGRPTGTADRFERAHAFGYHEVVIASPTHTPLLPFLPPEQMVRVVRMCRDRVRHLSSLAPVGSVTLFENEGPESGGSLWHPHLQLVTVPGRTPALEEEMQGAQRFCETAGATCAFEEVARAELAERTRVVFASAQFLGYAPFASAAPYEVRILPIRHGASLGGLADADIEPLARDLSAVLRALLTLLPGASYNLVARAPVGPSAETGRYHWHLDVIPRLVRPDGSDLGSGLAVNTVPPEVAAEALRTELGAKR